MRPPTASSSRGTAGEIFVAGLLAAVVSLLFAANAAVEPPVPGVVGDATEGHSEPVPAQRLDLRLQAQYEVGVRQLFSSGPSALDRLGLEEASARRLDALATTDRERVALAPVLGQLADSVEAGDERTREILSSLADDAAVNEGVREEATALLGLYLHEPSVPDDEMRQRLLDTYGWFAHLALDRLTAPDSTSTEALERARHVALAMMATLAVLGLVFLCGIGAALVALQRVATGRWQSAYAADTTEAETPRLPYLETALLFLVALTVIGAVSALAAHEFDSQWWLMLNWLVVPVFLWPTVRGRSARDLRTALGWHPGRGLLAEAGSGLFAYLAAMPLLALGLLLTLGVTRLTDETPHHPIVDWLSEAGTGDLVVVVLLAVVWAPLVEESLFRGGLYHYLRGRFGVVGSALVVSLVFAAIHPQGVAGIPFLGALAVSLALVREWRGSIVASMTLHMVHNGLATLTLIFLLTP